MRRHTCKDVAQLLAAQSERFCRWLYPTGKVKSGEFCVGDLAGSEGDSLRVHLNGERAGIWKDFASGEKGGDLLDLLARSRMLPMAAAVKEAKTWLGIRDPEPVNQPQPWKKAKRPEGLVSALKHPDVLNYLTKDRRLAIETVSAFRLGGFNREIAFPSMDPGGELISIKYIGLDRPNGKKQIRQEPGCPPALFGWQALNPDTREVVITEGQIDAMTWYQMGFQALSIPNGIGDLNGFIDYEWENLDQFDVIYLCFDNEKKSQEAVAKVSERLGHHRCLIIDMAPYKDPNEALQAGSQKSDFERWITSAKPIMPVEIRRPMDFHDDVLEFFHPKGGKIDGLVPDIFEGKIIFRPHQLSVWLGFSSHGKSAILNQVMLQAMADNQRVAIASMEMPGHITLARMISQMTRSTKPSKELCRKVLEWMDRKCWIYDLIGQVTPERVLKLMEYSLHRHGIHHFVVDSLMKLSIRSDDYDGQRQFCNDLHSFSLNHKCHIHLVSHSRKRSTEKATIGKQDAKGSSDIVNQADQVFIVMRNKAKEELRAKGRLGPDEELNKPDCIVICDKERVHGNECRIPLWHLQGVHLFCRKEFNQVKIPSYSMVFSSEATVVDYKPKAGIVLAQDSVSGADLSDMEIED